MFTTVNSKRKNFKHSSNSNADNLSPIQESSNTEKLSILNQLTKFFSFSDNFFKLQLAIFSLTLIVSIFASLLTGFFISFSFGLSLFLGSIAGVLYLRLLAKSIGNLGKTNSSISKLQLLIPVCLFVFASKNEFIELLPAIIGFFIYKPALIFYFSRS